MKLKISYENDVAEGEQLISEHTVDGVVVVEVTFGVLARWRTVHKFTLLVVAFYVMDFTTLEEKPS